MRRRCTDSRVKQYANYGGRGICVCKEWAGSFDTFVRDMGPRPPGTTLDRINNDGNYEPGNCRWSTRFEQCRNRRVTRFITYDGLRLSTCDWADRLGIKLATMDWRIKVHGEQGAIAMGPRIHKYQIMNQWSRT